MPLEKVTITRRMPSTPLTRYVWDEPEIPDGFVLAPRFYHEAIGMAISNYNGLEAYFKSLVAGVAGLKPLAGSALLTHFGAMAAIEALRALANEGEFIDVIQDEIQFACTLFDKNRINRNFITHTWAGSLFPMSGPHGDGMLMTKRTAKGFVKIDHYLASIEAFRKTADEMIDCTEYFSLVHGPLIHAPKGGEVILPERPTLPKLLADELPKGRYQDLVHLRETPNNLAHLTKMPNSDD